MITSPHTELESLRRMHARDVESLRLAADLIAKMQAQLAALKPKLH